MAERKLPTLPGIDVPSGETATSYLVDETNVMEFARHKIEQDTLRRMTKVHAEEHQDLSAQAASVEQEMASTPQHPWFASQRYDGLAERLGIDPSDPFWKSKLDNELREQEKEKQLRLNHELNPKFNPKPSFNG